MRIPPPLAPAIVLFAICLMTGSSATIVDDDWTGADYDTIQDAVDSSSSDDTIYVHSGDYYESLFINHSLEIIGNGTSTRLFSNDTAITSSAPLAVQDMWFSAENGVVSNDIVALNDVQITVSPSGEALTAGAGTIIDGLSVWNGSISLVGPSINAVDSTFISTWIDLDTDGSLNGSYLEDCSIGVNGTAFTLTTSILEDCRITIFSDSNTFYDNIFRECEIEDKGSNTWNTTPADGENIVGGAKVGGNYWYDYAGSDSDSDGIGDDPHPVDQDTYDDAPLVHPPAEPVILFQSILPLNASHGAIREFSLTYIDMNDDTAEYARAVSDSITVNLTEGPGDPRNGTYFNGTAKLPIGIHEFHFEVSDGTNVVTSQQIGVNSTNDPPNVDIFMAPTSGNQLTIFRVESVYTDLDGDLPASIEVEVLSANGTQTDPMSEVESLDLDPKDGKDYFHNLTLEPGSYTIKIQASDGDGSAVSETLNLTVRNEAPEIEGAVIPATGTRDTPFNFTLLYKDLDGDAPSVVNLRLNGFNHTMLSAGGDAETGITYYIVLQLAKGTHWYRFFAEDIEGNLNSTENSTIDVLNSKPVVKTVTIDVENGLHNFTVMVEDKDQEIPLFSRLVIDAENVDMELTKHDQANFQYNKKVYLREGSHEYFIKVSDSESTITSNSDFINTTAYPRLLNGTASPAQPTSSDEITFKVTYREKDGNPPTFVKLNIGNSTHLMDSDGGSALTGIEFTAKTTLPKGVHTYGFNASNGDHYNYTMEATIEVLNSKPAVDIEIHPSSPEPGAEFTITICYDDADGDPPSVNASLDASEIGLLLSKAGDCEWNLNNTTSASRGEHLVEVVFSDGSGPMTYREWIIVDNAPVIDSSWMKMPNGTIAVIANITDLDNDPIEIELVHNGLVHQMSPVLPDDNDTTDGREFIYYAKPVVGMNEFQITANDSLVAVVDEFEIDTGPAVNSPPQLSAVTMAPNEPSIWDMLRFTVYYHDPDGNIPELVKLVLKSGGSEERIVMRFSQGASEADGKYVTTFRVGEGNYTYFIEASDGLNSTKTAESAFDVIATDKPPEQNSVEKGAEANPLIEFIGDPMMLLMIVLVIIGMAAIAGARSRSGRKRGSSPVQFPQGPPSGVDEFGLPSETSHVKQRYVRPQYEAPEYESVEFQPAQVEFSPGAPAPEQVEFGEEVDWREQKQAAAGPFVSTRARPEEAEADFTPVQDGDWSEPEEMAFEPEEPSTADDGWGSDEGFRPEPSPAGHAEDNWGAGGDDWGDPFGATPSDDFGAQDDDWKDDAGTSTPAKRTRTDEDWDKEEAESWDF